MYEASVVQAPLIPECKSAVNFNLLFYAGAEQSVFRLPKWELAYFRVQGVALHVLTYAVDLVRWIFFHLSTRLDAGVAVVNNYTRILRHGRIEVAYVSKIRIRRHGEDAEQRHSD